MADCPLTIDKADAAISLVRRVGVAVMWLTFAVFHLALLGAGLFLLWCFQVQPGQLFGWLLGARDSQLALWLGAGGITALGLLALYVRAWRKIYTALTTPYFFAEIDAAFRRKR